MERCTVTVQRRFERSNPRSSCTCGANSYEQMTSIRRMQRKREHYVVARAHPGTSTLDLTIPAQYRADFNLKAGEMYMVRACIKDGLPAFVYEKVEY